MKEPTSTNRTNVIRVVLLVLLGMSSLIGSLVFALIVLETFL